jgi:hypothetical protein
MSEKRQIQYQGKLVTIESEIMRRNPTIGRNHEILTGGGVLCQLSVEGNEVFDWIPYETLYEPQTGRPRVYPGTKNFQANSASTGE